MALNSVFHHVSKACNIPLLVQAGKLSTRNYSKFVNQITLLGRVGKEPTRVGENSDAVAFPLFTESSVKQKDGGVKVYPAWHRVLVIKKGLADAVCQSVDRGQRCYISGRIAYRAPEVNESGKTVFNNQAVILCDQIVFLEKSKRQDTPERLDSAAEAEDPKEAISN